MSDTCDKPIFRGNVSDGPSGHCVLPKTHSGSCKLPEDLKSGKDVLPEKCPYDNWLQNGLCEKNYQYPYPPDDWTTLVYGPIRLAGH
jgi:hypothetical protein